MPNDNLKKSEYFQFLLQVWDFKNKKVYERPLKCKSDWVLSLFRTNGYVEHILQLPNI